MSQKKVNLFPPETIVLVLGVVLAALFLAHGISSGNVIVRTLVTPQLTTAIPAPLPVLPGIVYYKATNNKGVQRFASCANADCSSVTLRTLDDAGANAYVGTNNVMTRALDNSPLITYWDSASNRVKVTKCNDPTCATGFSSHFIDNSSANLAGGIAVLPNGNPGVSYSDFALQDLKMVQCANPSCSSIASTVTVDATGLVGDFSRIQIGADGLPIITYRHAYGAAGGNNDLGKVAHCNNVACTSSTITILDTVYNGFSHDLIIGSDGKPLIVYNSNVAGVGTGLTVIHCGNAACTTGNTSSIVESQNGQISFSMRYGSDGLPIFVYNAGYISPVTKVVHCGNVFCSAGNSIQTISPTAMGQPSLSISSDGKPIVAYQDQATSDLYVVKCTTLTCSAHAAPTLVEGSAQASTNIGLWNGIH